ncbi:hypothetical protein ACFL2Q_00060 [Thermodesulfobacteriota bacterium]
MSRRGFFLQADLATSAEQIRHILSFVPAHRYVLVAGAAPKWVKRMEGPPRQIEYDSPEELKDALDSAIEEEKLGSRPIQFTYFGADAETYEGILSHLKKGWVAIVDDVDPILSRLPSSTPKYESAWSESIKAVHLGERPENLEFETDFLKKMDNSIESVQSFLIQKKFSEMHLAGSAIVRWLEDGWESISKVDMERLLELDEQTLEQTMKLILAERDLDISRYLALPSEEVLQKGNQLCEMEHVVAVAAVEKGKVMFLKRLTTTEIEVYTLALHVALAYDRVPDEARLGAHFWLSISSREGENVIATKALETIYVVVMSKASRVPLSVATISELLS